MIKHKPCIFCGSTTDVTKDHVPPKSLFPKPRPNNLITVPSCRKCNESTQENDEQLSIFISMLSGMEGDIEKKLHDKTRRAFQKNNQFKKKLKEEKLRLPIIDQNGEITDYVYLVKWESDKINEILKKTIAGLYYHHYKLEIRKIGYIELFTETLKHTNHPIIQEIIKACKPEVIGHNGEVIYQHGSADDDPLSTFWAITLYKRFQFIGITSPLIP